MKVKCKTKFPNEEQAKKLGKYYHAGKQEFGLTIGKEYIVFGLRILDGAVWVELVSDTGYLYSTPLCLFGIIDGRVSRYWETRVDEDGDVDILPPSFYSKYYYDDLLERVSDVVEDFRKIRSLIESEAMDTLTT